MNQSNISEELKENAKKSSVILLSGGLDSAVCLSIAASVSKKIKAIFFEYGQKTAKREKKCAEALAEHYNIAGLNVVDARFLAAITSAALCDQGTEVTKKNEYVPFRNGIFLSIATALAEKEGADSIYIGSTGGDRICRDNSKEFRRDFEKVIVSGTNSGKEISIDAPLENGDKKYVVSKGVELNTPFALTWSCHNRNDVPCGICSNCISRAEAFRNHGIKDPVNT